NETLPELLVTASSTVLTCDTEEITLDAGGSTGQDDLAFAWSTGDSGAQILVTEPGSYSVTLTDNANGCTATETVVITQNISLPIANAGINRGICVGESTTLQGQASGAENLVFSWSPAAGLSATDILTPLANPIESTVYTLTVTNPATGCSATDDVQVLVNPLPELLLIETVCDVSAGTYAVRVLGGPAILSSLGTVTAEGGNVTLISNIPDGVDVTITALNPTTDCETDLEVTAPNCACPLVQAPESNGDFTICPGDDFPTLSVDVAANLEVDWYDAPTDGNLLLENSVIFTPTVAGTYYAEARELTLGCVSDTRTAVTVTVEELPTISFTGETAICEGETILITAVADGTPVVSWAWSGPNSFAQQGETLNIPFAGPVRSGTYTVVGTTFNGCTATTTIEVVVNEFADIDFVLPAAVCQNAETLELTATPAGGTFSGPGVDGTTLQLTELPLGETEVTYTFTTPEGCENSQTTSVTIEDCGAGALCFDSFDDFLQLPNSVVEALSEGDELTVEFWFNGVSPQHSVYFAGPDGTFIDVGNTDNSIGNVPRFEVNGQG
ncbi:MAG: hypothetical protein AAF597_12990, partial [Bacteroidota bacterium]